MKVDIQHKEITRGLIFKKTFYQVSTTVQFTEEEKFIIKKQKMKDDVVHQRDRPAGVTRTDIPIHHYYLHVDQLLKGTDHYVVATVLEAKAYEAQLMESLKTFKEILSHSGEITEKNKSFEL